MVPSLCKWKILEWDENPQTNDLGLLRQGIELRSPAHAMRTLYHYVIAAIETLNMS